MSAWMSFVVVVTFLCGASALAGERLLLAIGRPTRWIWFAAIIFPLALVLLAHQVATSPPPQATLESVGLVSRSNDLRAVAAAPAVWVAQQMRSSAGNDTTDSVLVTVWLCSSLVMAAILIYSFLSLRRRLSNARVEWIDGTRVLVTNDVGPAVTGIMRPQICMPSWINTLPRGTRDVAFAHEREHLLARDTNLYGLSLLLLTTMPWNLPLWWLHSRLRLAIEIDCDGRVLRRGYTLSQYGESLLQIAAHGTERGLPAAVGLHASASSLERRVRALCEKRRMKRSVMVMLAAVCACTATLAASINSPPQPLTIRLASDRASTLPPIPSPVASVMNDHDTLATALQHYFPELAAEHREGRTIIWLLTDERGAVIRKASETVADWAVLEFSDADWKRRALAFGVEDSATTQRIVLESSLSGNRVVVAWMMQPGAKGPRTHGPSIQLPGNRSHRESQVVNVFLAHQAVIEHFDSKAITVGTPPGIELWFVMDANGYVLRNGRRPTMRDPEAARRDIEARVPGVRVAYVSRGTAVKNARRERVQVSWHWLEGDSPLPADESI